MPSSTTAARVDAPEQLARPPRYATRRNPALRTRGGKVAVLAAEMGRPLKPHQQYIADVGTELNPPGSRLRYRYQLVVISLPRQTGKTTLMRPVFLERTLSGSGVEAYMTAQHGKDAGKRWEQLVSDVETSPLLGSFVTVKRGKGDQACMFPNGSYIAPFAPGPKSLHGYTPPLVLVDEGWAFDAEGGADLMKAIRPAQITRPDRQLWIISAAGDATSEWWEQLTAAGRASVDDPLSTMAYFEWSMDPDADPYDPASWDFHPGLDGLITKDDLREEAKPENNSHGDYLRGFMNISTKVRTNTVVNISTWDDLAGEQPAPKREDVAYAYDVAVDRSSASVWSSWRDDDGVLQLHVEARRDGAAWLVEHVAAMLDAGLLVAADDGGPARGVTKELQRRGHHVETLNGRDLTTAWANLKGAVEDRALVHDGSPALRDALQVAVERNAGDMLAPSRRHSLGPIDPAVAATVAAWFADHAGAPAQIF